MQSLMAASFFSILWLSAWSVEGFDREERCWHLNCIWLCQTRTGFAHGLNMVAQR
jgi:hypothetical protein